MGSNNFLAVPGNLCGPERGIFTGTRVRARNLLHSESPVAPRETEDGMGVRTDVGLNPDVSLNPDDNEKLGA
jgi:hypothetical protein